MSWFGLVWFGDDGVASIALYYYSLLRYLFIVIWLFVMKRTFEGEMEWSLIFLSCQMFTRASATIRQGWFARACSAKQLLLSPFLGNGRAVIIRRSFHRAPCLYYPTKDSFPVIPANYPKEALEYIPDAYSSNELNNLLQSNTLSIPDV